MTLLPMAFRSLLSLLRLILRAEPQSTPSRHDQALFETTKRLLAEIVNEGLVDATTRGSKHQPVLYLHRRLNSNGTKDDGTWIRVSLKPGTVLETKHGRVVAVVRPDSLQPPVIICDGEKEEEELDPGILLRFASPWLLGDASEDVLEAIALELQNSARNQGKQCVSYNSYKDNANEVEKWLEVSAGQRLLTLDDESVAWERALIYGHPSHPVCHALMATSIQKY